MPLRGILFDLDDTLADSSGVEGAVWEHVVEAITKLVPGVDRAELRRRYLEVLEEHYAPLAAGHIDFLTFRRNRLADALAPWGEVSDELFERYLREKERIADEMRPFPDAIATVRALRAQGVKVGVLTNGPSDFQRRKLEISGIGSELDAIAISGELGVAKPEREAFDRALALLGTKADETAMVGDSLENDVLGGIEAGFAAVVWMPGRRKGNAPPGAHVARALAEVPALLDL